MRGVLYDKLKNTINFSSPISLDQVTKDARRKFNVTTVLEIEEVKQRLTQELEVETDEQEEEEVKQTETVGGSRSRRIAKNNNNNDFVYY